MKNKNDPRGLLMVKTVDCRVNGRKKKFAEGHRYSTGYAEHLPVDSFVYWEDTQPKKYDSLVVEYDG
jgi:hypothetical protein